MPEHADEKWRWEDPDPDSTGVLLSDRIEYYIKKVKLIDPFKKRSLRPASYSLHASDEYYENDVLQHAKNGLITIPSNGLIYLRLQEEINLPYYMTAQHNLKVKQNYRGFLAGISLQIDPGYRGHINYPVYNFTNRDKTIKVGDAVNEIAFFKTTPFGNKDFWRKHQVMSELELEKADAIVGLDNNECITFKNKEDRIVSQYWLPGDTHISSVAQMEKDIEEFGKKIGAFETEFGKKIEAFEEKADKLQIRGIYGVIAVIVAVVSMICFNIYFMYDQHLEVERWVRDTSVAVEKAIDGGGMAGSLKKVEFSGHLDINKDSTITEKSENSIEIGRSSEIDDREKAENLTKQDGQFNSLDRND